MVYPEVAQAVGKASDFFSGYFLDGTHVTVKDNSVQYPLKAANKQCTNTD
jgi:hypothetical protein